MVARFARAAMLTRADNQSLGKMRGKTYKLDQGVYIWDDRIEALRVGTVVFTNPPIHDDYLVYRNDGGLHIACKANVYTSQRKALARARAEVRGWSEKYIY